MKHMGLVLKAVVENDKQSITKIVKKAGFRSRQSYYGHIKMAIIPFHILRRYGKAMLYDFSVDFPEMRKDINNRLDEAEEIYAEPETKEQAIKLLHIWKNKYTETSDKYNSLIDKLNKLGMIHLVFQQ